MSFSQYKDYIEEGDLVLAFISRDHIKPITVAKGAILNTRYGNFPHDSMIGTKYGSQIAGAKGYGFIHLLHPTPELWTLSLPHRTQIVYTPDSSYITQRLGITVGSIVIEAGTGSGSFSHSFARTLGSKGKLFTYEFHEPRYLEAKKELEEHGLSNFHITHRDVCNDGFDIVDNTTKEKIQVQANSVFLDLPAPWEAIPNLNSVITRNSRVGICCFSPCIEQVEKTVEALQSNGWTSIEMVEISAKRWEARKEMVKRIEDVLDRLRDIQSRKNQGIEKRRHIQLQTKDATESGSEDLDSNTSTKRSAESPASSPAPGKRQKEEKFQNLEKGFNPFGKGLRIREGDSKYEWRNVTKVEPDVKSHTSYLTFAFREGETSV